MQPGSADTAAVNLRRQFGATFRLEIGLNNPANMQAAEGLLFSGDDSGQAVISRELAEQNQNSR